jgi:hypothetical protein
MVWLTVQAALGLDPDLRAQRHNRISIIFCVFLFLFVTLHGVTSTLGLVLELYPPESVDQYSWPVKRILLFLPMAAVVVLWTVREMVRTLRQRERDSSPPPDKLTTLMTGLAAVGAVSIWPAKIGILYAVALCIALWVFNHLNRHLDKIDGRPAS